MPPACFAPLDVRRRVRLVDHHVRKARCNMARGPLKHWNRYAVVHNEGIGYDAGGIPGLPIPKGAGAMAFQRRGRARGFRARRRFPRRPGAYEILLTDGLTPIGGASADSLTPNFSVTFRNGAFPDPDVMLQDNDFLGSPPGAFGTTQDVSTRVHVHETSGFTTLIPLWDQALSLSYDHSARLRSLRGYLIPQYLRLQQAAADVGTGVVARVRLELLPLDISTARLNYGQAADVTGAIEDFMSFSREGQRRKIWWQREYLVAFNNLGTFNFWQNDTAGGDAEKFSTEPRFAALNGSNSVNLKNLMTIRENRWPFLAISVQAEWPEGTTVPFEGQLQKLNGTAGQEVLCTVSMLARLKAYVQK